MLNCTVGVVRTRLECPKHFAITVPPSDMGEGLKAFLDSGAGCDVVFQVGDEEFKAHKLILAARSPVFKAQFFGHLGDSSVDKVVVKDVEPFIFKVKLLLLLLLIIVGKRRKFSSMTYTLRTMFFFFFFLHGMIEIQFLY